MNDQKFPTKIIAGPDDFTSKFYQILKEKKISLILHNIEILEGGTLPYGFMRLAKL